MTGEYKQFKLTNGDEMICELVTTGDDDSTADVIVRRAMKIVITDDLEENTRYYTLKPWMSFQDSSTELVALNSVHIVGEASPSDTVMIHYATALAEVDKYNKLRKTNLTLEEIEEQMRELSEEDMDNFLNIKFGEEAEVEKSYDSDSPNVILFKPKNTVH